jgi:phosphohistidine phosphatase
MLILMRHGEAGWDAPSDHERVLTESGIICIGEQMARYEKSMATVDKVVCSSYFRARQTAALLLKACMPGADLVIDDRWSPESSVSDAMLALEEHWVDNLLVVTHQPLIGYAVPFLIEGDIRSPEPLLPGQLVVLDVLWPGRASAIRLPL